MGRDVWALAWPAMLSFVVVNVIDVIDVAFVGQLGRTTGRGVGYVTQSVNLVETFVA